MLKGICITVRSDSSRLPGKALRKINGLATIEHLINRVKRSTKADKVVVCTTTLSSDDEICRLASKNGVNFFRGSVEDKLERCLQAAEEFNFEYFVNVDGDDLFCEVELIDLAFEKYEKEKPDFIKTHEDKLICGAFTFGMKVQVLKEICQKKNTSNTEAAWLAFAENQNINTVYLEDIPRVFHRPEIRATLDYQEDFDFFKTIIDNFFAQGKENFSLRDVVSFVDENPEVLMINKHRHNDYLQNQKKLLTDIGI